MHSVGRPEEKRRSLTNLGSPWTWTPSSHSTSSRAHQHLFTAPIAGGGPLRHSVPMFSAIRAHLPTVDVYNTVWYWVIKSNQIKIRSNQQPQRWQNYRKSPKSVVLRSASKRERDEGKEHRETQRRGNDAGHDRHPTVAARIRTKGPKTTIPYARARLSSLRR